MPATETFHGFIESTTDTLLIFEACRRGILPKVNRRLQERERGAVKSGTVYVFDERESGIKRWTDGYIWSPSRILGNFLIYRELDGRDSIQDRRRPISYNASQGYNPYNHPLVPPQVLEEEDESMNGPGSALDRNRERALVGSLTTSYNFKKGGLIKKTMSVIVNGSAQHLISYYTKEDVLNNRLRTPSSIPELAALDIAPELLLRQSFRIPPMAEHALNTSPDHHQNRRKEMIVSPLSSPYSLYPSSHSPMRRRASEAFSNDLVRPVSTHKTSRFSVDSASPGVCARSHHFYMEPYAASGGHHGSAGHGGYPPDMHHQDNIATSEGMNNHPNELRTHDMCVPMLRYTTATTSATTMPFPATLSPPPPPTMDSTRPVVVKQDLVTESPPPSPFYGRPRKLSIENTPLLWQQQQQQQQHRHHHQYSTTQGPSAPTTATTTPSSNNTDQYRSPLSVSSSTASYFPPPPPLTNASCRYGTESPATIGIVAAAAASHALMSSPTKDYHHPMLHHQSQQQQQQTNEVQYY